MGWVIVFLCSLPLSVYIYFIFTGTKWEKLVNSLLFVSLLNLFPCLYFISILQKNNPLQLTQLIIPVLFLSLLAILVCLKLYLFLKPPANTETERTDPQKKEIELELPFDKTFDACMEAVRQFMYHELEQFDPDAGTITAMVSNADPGISFAGFPQRESRITFSLRKTSTTETTVVVTSVPVLHLRYSAIRTSYLRSPIHETNNLRVIATFLQGRMSEPDRTGKYPPARPGVPGANREILEPDVVAFMSLIIPGLGQNYTGRYLRGIIFMAGVAAGLAFFIVPGIVLWIAGAFDAYRIAQKINDNTLPFIPNKTGMIVFHVIATGAMLYLGFSLVRMGYYPYLG
ncbi:MAG: hypothetical protein LUQ35_04555 [Methanoregula sp.]|nr:hypothetical protein [Methanoregula sp.]